MSDGRAIKWTSLLVVVLGLGGCRTAAPQPVEMTTEEQSVAPQVPPDDDVDPMVSVDTLLEAQEGFASERVGTEAYPVPAYAKYLEGVRICLDPGHGGDAHKRGYKRGPTGVREAEINLRVAKYLRCFLEHVGAEVLLTREEDVDLSLKERAELANNWPADLFISCHHNAVDNKPSVNHTTVWYHRDVDHRPANLDLARYLCQGLLDALALPKVVGVPLRSDQLMYETGFGVLRNAQVTAALTESSFFSNPEEEQRLRDPEYSLQEAYGLFLALARYAAGGLPHAELASPADAVIAAGVPATLEFELDDGLRSRKSWGHDRQMILTDSIAVRIDGEPAAYVFANEGYRLTVDLPPGLVPGQHEVEVQFQNMFKNSTLDPRFEIDVR